MSNRIPQSALRRKDQMSHKRSVMSNKRNAVMSVIHVIWFQDVSLAQRRRNPTIARRDIYICLYICFPIYIYVYIHNLILCQNECQMSACGHALFVQRFMYTCICMHVCSFLLKRSMYDYKLYVSLLIFVYSLMDSDERASLQKKVFWIKQPSNIPHEHVVQCFTYNACCIPQVMYIQKKSVSFNRLVVTGTLVKCMG